MISASQQGFCKLQGPPNDQDEESELTVAEMKAQREKQKKEAEVLRQMEAVQAEQLVHKKLKDQQDVGCTWGFGKKSLLPLVHVYSVIQYFIAVVES